MRGWIWALSSACFALAAASPARADDLSTIRARVIDHYTAASAPAGDPGVQSLQKNITNSASSSLVKLGSNGKFSDLSYTDQPAAGWSVSTHFSRVLTLAQAYSFPSGALYHDVALKQSIESALGYGSQYYCGDSSCVVGNWWFWEIGVPLALGPTLILMQNDLDATLFQTLVAALTYQVGDVPHMNKFTGENLLWCAMNHLRIGLLHDNPAELDPVRAAVETSATIDDVPLEDGIKPDHSFIQHGGQPYTGGYGAGYAADVSTYLQLTDGTAYALAPDQQANAIDYVTDGVAWTVFESYFDPAVVGREITRPGKDAAAARNAFVELSFVSSPRQAELRSAAKATVAALGTGSIDVVALAEQLDSLPEAAGMPSGHRHYPFADHTVHRRDGYYASIKMLSTRTKSGELVNSEGKQGSRQSDGHLYLVRAGTEYFGPKLWPALDWSRLPGITVEQNGNAANEDYGVGTTSFVGGTGDGQNGVSAMESEPLKTTLHAKKSWFFFDDFIVFLGSDITDTASAPVETIVEQWPLTIPDAPLFADGVAVASGSYAGTIPKPSWISADGLGYFFPNATDVDAEIKDQSGDWSSLGVSSGSVSARFLTLSLSHGSAPSGASYAYAIALEGQDMAAWIAGNPFTILKNDPSIAAVHAEQSTGIVFWDAGSLDLGSGTTLTTDTPATVYVTDDGNLISVSAADPAWGSGSMKLTFSGTFQDAVAGDPGVSVDASTGTVTIDRENGVTHSAELSRQGKVPVTPDAGADAGGNDAGSDAGPAAKNPPAADSDGGCGCRAARGNHAASALLALAALFWLGSRRRARRT
jgi:Polysaccharide lyase family 8, super-sandwich domain/Polysaccharide lyase family 8, N terminal alpha-helical domain/Polysaccharide lyase family 8, C-terminal beta-sandwich domain